MPVVVDVVVVAVEGALVAVLAAVVAVLVAVELDVDAEWPPNIAFSLWQPPSGVSARATTPA